MSWNFCKWHENPLNIAFHCLAFVALLAGLWFRDWTVIIVAVIVAALGHLVQMLSRKKQIPQEKIKKKRR